MGRANQVRDEIISLGWHKHYLILDDVAVVVRHLDGSFTLDREAFPAASNVLGCSVVGFVAGLVLGGPTEWRDHRRHGRRRWHRHLGLGCNRRHQAREEPHHATAEADDFVREVKQLRSVSHQPHRHVLFSPLSPLLLKPVITASHSPLSLGDD